MKYKISGEQFRQIVLNNRRALLAIKAGIKYSAIKSCLPVIEKNLREQNDVFLSILGPNNKEERVEKIQEKSRKEKITSRTAD